MIERIESGRESFPDLIRDGAAAGRPVRLETAMTVISRTLLTAVILTQLAVLPFVLPARTADGCVADAVGDGWAATSCGSFAPGPGIRLEPGRAYRLDVAGPSIPDIGLLPVIVRAEPTLLSNSPHAV